MLNSVKHGSHVLHMVSKNHGVVVDASIHAPHGKNVDKRNYHAHVMFSTRRFENGQFTEKHESSVSVLTMKKNSKSTLQKVVMTIRSVYMIERMLLNYYVKRMRRSATNA